MPVHREEHALYLYRLNRRSLIAAAVAITAGAGSLSHPRGISAAMQATTSPIDLGTLGGAASEARAINSLGQVVGWSFDQEGVQQAFFWDGSSMVALPHLGSFGANALDIDDAGRIVGFASADTGYQHAVLWQDGGIVDLQTLGGLMSWANAIGADDSIVGASVTDSDRLRAFEMTIGSVMKDLGALADDSDSEARAIGAAGIVGWSTGPEGLPQAVRWTAGDIEPLAPDWQFGSSATGINSAGQICGNRTDEDGRIHAVIWEEDGNILDLGADLDIDSEALSIDEQGNVAGYLADTSGMTTAVAWISGSMVELAGLGGPRSQAFDIEGEGQVVGVAQLSPDEDNAAPRATLWRIAE
jgi:probable HAF family extracellular repeat protein